jgi:hypothetical protein
MCPVEKGESNPERVVDMVIFEGCNAAPMTASQSRTVSSAEPDTSHTTSLPSDQASATSDLDIVSPRTMATPNSSEEGRCP